MGQARQAVLLALASLLGQQACQSDQLNVDGGLGAPAPKFVVDGSGGTDGQSAASGGEALAGAEASGGSSQIGDSFDYCMIDGEKSEGDPGVRLLIDDFDDGDPYVTGNGMEGTWYGYGDPGGSQTPTWDNGEWASEAGGLDAEGYALHASGGGYDEWGSGQGLSPAWSEERDQSCLYDASAYDGVTFWMRGKITDVERLVAGTQDAGVLRFGAADPDIVPVEEGGNCTGDAGPCWDWHKTRIELGTCWRRYSFRFDELEQDGWGADAGDFKPDQLVNFNFEIAQGQDYDFWLDEFSFFVGDTPPEEERCLPDMGGLGGAGGAGGASP